MGTVKFVLSSELLLWIHENFALSGTASVGTVRIVPSKKLTLRIIPSLELLQWDSGESFSLWNCSHGIRENCPLPGTAPIGTHKNCPLSGTAPMESVRIIPSLELLLWDP
jgi:hypothetical protein